MCGLAGENRLQRRAALSNDFGIGRIEHDAHAEDLAMGCADAPVPEVHAQQIRILGDMQGREVVHFAAAIVLWAAIAPSAPAFASSPVRDSPPGYTRARGDLAVRAATSHEVQDDEKLPMRPHVSTFDVSNMCSQTLAIALDRTLSVSIYNRGIARAW
jgi:hypothetical protein